MTMHLRTVRARLLMVLLAGLTVVLVVNRYWFDVDWFPWTAFEPCYQDAYWKFGHTEPTYIYTPDFCGAVRRNLPVDSITLLAIYVFAVVCLYRPLARWVLAPLRDLRPLLAQVGPQNLGLRIPGGRGPEATALATAVNAMLDRVAAGYEGQRSFAANASHELRTPLALQRMIVEVAMAEPLTAEQSALVKSQLLQSIERSERIIEGLLTLSQAEQGLVAHTPQPAGDIAAEVVTAHLTDAAEAAITLTSDLQPVQVDGDRILLERLIRNLVHNALKYNHPDGTAHVSLDATGVLTVSNTGPVVPAAEAARLFEPFTRLTGDRIDHTGGSGLGLTIVRAIARSHHGTVTATPGPSGGLLIAVRFPPRP